MHVSQTFGVLSIFTSYDGDSTDVGFTLTAYAGVDLKIAWDDKVSTPPFTRQVRAFYVLFGIIQICDRWKAL